MTGERQVEIAIVVADALSFEIDVLVLKHAQASLGVDAAAKRLIGLDLEMDLLPGGQMIVAGAPALGAEKVVFLGVPPLREFGYPEIRLFARRAISLVGAELPDSRQIGLTLHGTGYGLDEAACFEAELAGLMDAFELGTAPLGLERVVILEADGKRAERLSKRLATVLSNSDGVAGVVRVPPGPEVGERLGESAANAPADRDYAFVAMPFSKPLEDVFYYGIETALHKNQLLCERIDRVVFTGDVLSHIKERIRAATLVVANLTGANPNVYLEVGFAWAAGVPVVLVCDAASDLKFDVQGEKCLMYGSIRELEERLTAELEQLVG